MQYHLRVTMYRSKPTRNQIRQEMNKTRNIQYIDFVFCFIPEYVHTFSEKVIEKHTKYR